jgi:pSer/pThr/pTyr-binding forkhead associated (FHA) protein
MGGPPSAAMGAPSVPSQQKPPAEPGARRALAGFLVSYQDDALGKHWVLWQGKNSVGRADTGQKVDIEIAHGTTSTHHATIECDPQRFVLSDLGSTNGTFHNEEAIGFQGKREIRDGDKIRFGGYSVMVVNVVSRT